MRIGNDGYKLLTFVILGVLAAVVLYLTLAQQPLEATRDYTATMTNASGLEPGNPIRVAGVQVGRVNGVSIEPHNLVKVSFSVKKSQPVTTATTFAVRYQDLLGNRYAQLQQQPDQGQPLPDGATIPPSRTVPALDLNVLLNGFQPLFHGLQPQQVNELATNIIQTLQGEGGTVQQLLAQTASLTSGVASHDQEIGDLITSLNGVLGDVDQRDTQLRSTITGLQQLISGLDADRKPIVDALDQIATVAGSVNGLLSQVRPPLKTTVTNLNAAAGLLDSNSESLQQVLTQIPRTYDVTARTASYGSWFNFYLCSVRLELTDSNGKNTYTPWFDSNGATKRCQ